MRKAADFLVEKRTIILIVVAVLVAASLFLLPKVKIISDMREYLPDDSRIHKGLQILEKAFPKTADAGGEIRVMFKGLDAKEKASMAKKLSGMPHVSQVHYEAGSRDYEKGAYTLYTVDADCAPGTSQIESLTKKLEAQFGEDEGYRMVYKITDDTTGSLKLWIIVAAIAMIMGILFLMCSSWVEPLLILCTIGMAVLLNMGTNAFLSSVSQTTHSIAAILQMVLSVDYSIILLNRYRQEREGIGTDAEAMKRALTGGFPAISSSALTTILGLLALVFMRFKIGADLGIVLAKGVLISLLCMFTVMPALVLMMQKAINRTQKKILRFSMDRLGKYSHRARFVVLAVFLLIFAGAFATKGNTNISYANADTPSKIDKIFPDTNDIVLLYRTADEEKAADFLKDTAAASHVKQVMSYGTVMGRQMTAAQMAHALASYTDSGMPNKTMLSVLYEYHFGTRDKDRMTAAQFLRFVSMQADKGTFGKQIDANTKKQLRTLQKFTAPGALDTPFTAAEAATFFGMSKEKMEQVYLYYRMQRGGMQTGKMTLPAFTSFLAESMEGQGVRSSAAQKDTKQKTQQLQRFTRRAEIKKKRTCTQMASMLQTDAGPMRLVYAARAAAQGRKLSSMTLPALVNFLQRHVLGDSRLAGHWNASAGKQIAQLKHLTDAVAITRPQSAQALASRFSMQEAAVAQILAMTGKTAMSEKDFVDLLLDQLAMDPAYRSMFSEEALASCRMMRQIMQMTLAGTKLQPAEAAALLGMDTANIRFLYAYHDSFTQVWKLDVATVVHYILKKQSSLGFSMSKKALAQLQMASRLMKAAMAGEGLTVHQTAALLGMKESQVRAVYLLKRAQESGGYGRITAAACVDFLAEIADDGAASSMISAGQRRQLRRAQQMVHVLQDSRAYTAAGMAERLAVPGASFDRNKVQLLYYYYFGMQGAHADRTMSMMQLARVLAVDVLQDPAFDGMLQAKDRRAIRSMYSALRQGAHQLRGKTWSIALVRTTMPVEGKTADRWYSAWKKQCDQTLGSANCYMIGNTPMSQEMQGTFRGELNKVTLLTIAAIFLVILLTFRNFLVPVLLVSVIQCAIYLTMVSLGLQGYSINYLALLIVQSILMGATIDYGILYTSYYREIRVRLGRQEALTESYRRSIHTILTSGSIMTIVVFAISFAFAAPMVSQICRTIAIGALCALLLILFVLPGLLAVFDRWVCPRQDKAQTAGRSG